MISAGSSPDRAETSSLAPSQKASSSEPSSSAAAGSVRRRPSRWRSPGPAERRGEHHRPLERGAGARREGDGIDHHPIFAEVDRVAERDRHVLACRAAARRCRRGTRRSRPAAAATSAPSARIELEMMPRNLAFGIGDRPVGVGIAADPGRSFAAACAPRPAGPDPTRGRAAAGYIRRSACMLVDRHAAPMRVASSETGARPGGSVGVPVQRFGEAVDRRRTARRTRPCAGARCGNRDGPTRRPCSARRSRSTGRATDWPIDVAERRGRPGARRCRARSAGCASCEAAASSSALIDDDLDPAERLARIADRPHEPEIAVAGRGDRSGRAPPRGCRSPPAAR